MPDGSLVSSGAQVTIGNMGASFINLEGEVRGSGQEVKLMNTVRGKSQETIALQDRSQPSTMAMWTNPVAQGIGRAETVKLHSLGAKIRSGVASDQTVELSDKAEPAMEASFKNVLSTKVRRRRHRRTRGYLFLDGCGPGAPPSRLRPRGC